MTLAASDPIQPLLNAVLNGTAAVLLVGGLAAIKAGAQRLHQRLMVAAFLVSAVFLASYLTYHLGPQKELGPTKFNGTGALKTAYYGMLISHVLLAVVNLPMVLRTFYLASRQRFEAHRRWARWTFPIWLYVSVTGVLVYLALYPFNPPAA
ncbi:MAG: DUF420 domain-containing protein [Planctomycetota bacterium]